uniref:ZP domain-containing protein n=1 Tax=Rhabditophanes sp. KR3021 TaxID=114890 RepID=A0AC35UGQ9_9BILA
MTRGKEAKIHDRIFGGISRPLSKFVEDNDAGMGIFDDIKVIWNHFGRKYKFSFKKDELNFINVYETLMRKIQIERPDFEGLIAYNDKSGRQFFISNDMELRQALRDNNNKLKIYTTVQQDKGFIAAADMIRKPQRSHSVPVDHARLSSGGSSQHSPLSSNSNNSHYYGGNQTILSKSREVNENLDINVGHHSPNYRTNNTHISPQVQSPRSSYDSNGGKVAVYNNNGGQMLPYPNEIPPGYAYSVTSIAPYNQHLNINSSSSVIYKLPLNATECGVWSFKKDDEMLGTEYSLSVIISFHPHHLTEDDKLFNLKCVFNAMKTSMNALIEINTFSKTSLVKNEFSPDCSYSLHRKSVEGSLIGKTAVGDKVFHVWKCNNIPYAMKVYNCYVHDGNKRQYLIVDESGCSNDLNILPQLIYDKSLNMAYSEAKVFKFAQSSHIHFSCLLFLCPKLDPHCTNYTPPKCNTQPNQTTRLRRSEVEGELVEANYTLNNDMKFINATETSFNICVFSNNVILLWTLLGFNLITLTILSFAFFYIYKHHFQGKINFSDGSMQPGSNNNHLSTTTANTSISN